MIHSIRIVSNMMYKRRDVMNISLVIMAAGIGSRFGCGIKQLESVGMNDEIIMDYSIHDAIMAGFNKIIFVIRRDIENDFREHIGNRIVAVSKSCGVEVRYVFQDINDVPDGCMVPEDREKPWGTGQAVLTAKNEISEPFVVINADDYYGQKAFCMMHDYLVSHQNEDAYCMAGFILGNTLSENGSVTRGICNVDVNGMLRGIVETKEICKTEYGATAGDEVIDLNCSVSMNMWGLQPEFMDLLEDGFIDFFEHQVLEDSCGAEYLLPTFIGNLLSEGRIAVEVLKTDDHWFGVTYKEDKPFVVDSIRKLIEDGAYQKDLYSDL